MMDGDECRAIGGMRIGRENRRTRKKTIPVPPGSPQMPHELTYAETRAAALGNWRLTA